MQRTKNWQWFKGTFSDATCNGVHVTPLHKASENGRLKVVLVLFAPGLDVDSRGSLYQYTVVVGAAEAGNIYITRMERGRNSIVEYIDTKILRPSCRWFVFLNLRPSSDAGRLSWQLPHLVGLECVLIAQLLTILLTNSNLRICPFHTGIIDWDKLLMVLIYGVIENVTVESRQKVTVIQIFEDQSCTQGRGKQEEAPGLRKLRARASAP